MTFRAPPDAAKMVGFVFRLKVDGTPIPIGTGFFVGVRDGDHGYRAWFVTARHVLSLSGPNDLTARFGVRINFKDETRGTIALEVPLDDWEYPLDRTVDLAWIRITDYMPSEYGPLVDVHVIEADDLRTLEQLKDAGLARGDDVTLVGMAHQIVESRNNPISREGHIAMVPTERLDLGAGKAWAIIAELDAFPSQSGSPVWAHIQPPGGRALIYFGRPQLLGLLHGFVTRRDTGTGENVSLAVVVPLDDFIQAIATIAPPG